MHSTCPKRFVSPDVSSDFLLNDTFVGPNDPSALRCHQQHHGRFDALQRGGGIVAVFTGS